MISSQIVAIFVRLTYAAHRQAALADLARHLALDSTMLLIKQTHTDHFSLVASSQRCDLPSTALNQFLDHCLQTGVASTLIDDAQPHFKKTVHGIAEPDRQCVLLMIGNRPAVKELTTMQMLLPFVAGILQDEATSEPPVNVAEVLYANSTNLLSKPNYQVNDSAAAVSYAVATPAAPVALRSIQAVPLAASNAAQHAEQLNNALSTSQHALQMAYERAEQELAYRREAENRLRVADRRKDEFLATVSHELRTPLNAILGWAQVLKMAAAVDSSQLKAIEAIIRNAKTQANLINDLLDTSSIVAGKIDLHMEALDLTDVLERACETVEPLAQQKHITIHSHYQILDEVRGDAARLRQVFWNLLCNAIKFTPDHGTVTIDARSDGQTAQIDVIDSGMGIEAGFLPYVFERFRQADASLRRKYGGLGLGLSIARQFIEMHNGEISVASDGAGCGTRFTVRLPCISAARPGSSAVGDLDLLAGAPDLQFMRILAVDDDPDARELVREMLEGFGAKVTIVSSALYALELLETESFDVLVSDIAMPELDGIALIGRVRSFKQPERAEIPALALTAFSDPQRFTEAYVAGFNLVMTKPVIALELGHALAQMV